MGSLQHSTAEKDVLHCSFTTVVLIFFPRFHKKLASLFSDPTGPLIRIIKQENHQANMKNILNKSTARQHNPSICRYFYRKSTLFGACYLGSLEPVFKGTIYNCAVSAGIHLFLLPSYNTATAHYFIYNLGDLGVQLLPRAVACITG